MGEDCIKRYDYVFGENGLVAYRDGTEITGGDTLITHSGEARLQRLLNYSLRMIADTELPVKRGNFIEFRRGMINVSPIGRSCTQSEREQFVEFDQRTGLRWRLVAEMRKEFPVEEYDLQFSIGGQISIDVFPVGWDKTYCLRTLKRDGLTTVHFFGDRIKPGGNDHEIYEHSDTVGHAVTSPANTKMLVEETLDALCKS